MSTPLPYKIIAFTSEGDVDAAENVAKEATYTKWGTQGPEKKATLTVKFPRVAALQSIEVINNGAAFIEVHVSREPAGGFTPLLPIQTLRSMQDCRQGKNLTARRVFGLSYMNRLARADTWGFLRVTVTQPFSVAQAIPIGLTCLALTDKGEETFDKSPVHAPRPATPPAPAPVPAPAAATPGSQGVSPTRKAASPAGSGDGLAHSPSFVLPAMLDDDDADDSDDAPEQPLANLRLLGTVREAAKIASESPAQAAPGKAGSAGVGAGSSGSSGDILAKWNAPSATPPRPVPAPRAAPAPAAKRRKKDEQPQAAKPPPAPRAPRKKPEAAAPPAAPLPPTAPATPPQAAAPGAKRPYPDAAGPSADAGAAAPAKRKKRDDSLTHKPTGGGASPPPPPPAAPFSPLATQDSFGPSPSQLWGSGNGPLAGKTVVLSGFQNPLRSELRTAALRLGAAYSNDWAAGGTHLICAFYGTPKYNEVSGGPGWIVKKEWLADCEKHGKRMPEKHYRLSPPPSSDDDDSDADSDDDDSFDSSDSSVYTSGDESSEESICLDSLSSDSGKKKKKKKKQPAKPKPKAKPKAKKQAAPPKPAAAAPAVPQPQAVPPAPQHAAPAQPVPAAVKPPTPPAPPAPQPRAAPAPAAPAKPATPAAAKPAGKPLPPWLVNKPASAAKPVPAKPVPAKPAPVQPPSPVQAAPVKPSTPETLRVTKPSPPAEPAAPPIVLDFDDDDSSGTEEVTDAQVQHAAARLTQVAKERAATPPMSAFGGRTSPPRDVQDMTRVTTFVERPLQGVKALPDYLRGVVAWLSPALPPAQAREAKKSIVKNGGKVSTVADRATHVIVASKADAPPGKAAVLPSWVAACENEKRILPPTHHAPA